MAHGEVGKVGVPVSHLGHVNTLLDQIPVGEMNTSMTINATAAWLLGLYVANAADHGVASKQLRGTTQNDIVKEYLSRGTYVFPPLPSRRLIVDMIAFCQEHIPLWNPMNVCSYHLQEAGDPPVARERRSERTPEAEGRGPRPRPSSPRSPSAPTRPCRTRRPPRSGPSPTPRV